MTQYQNVSISLIRKVHEDVLQLYANIGGEAWIISTVKLDICKKKKKKEKEKKKSYNFGNSFFG